MEEDSFKLTNAFTTVDSRSPIKISEEYRHIQHHDRTAAARAHKKLNSGYGPVPFHEHTMVCTHVHMCVKYTNVLLRNTH